MGIPLDNVVVGLLPAAIASAVMGATSKEKETITTGLCPGRTVPQADGFVELARQKPPVKSGSIGRHGNNYEETCHQYFCQQILQNTSGNFPIDFLSAS